MSTISKIVFGIIFVCLLPVLGIPLLLDIIAIIWAGFPWPMKAAIVIAVGVLCLAVLRAVLWALTGSSRFRR